MTDKNQMKQDALACIRFFADSKGNQMAEIWALKMSRYVVELLDGPTIEIPAPKKMKIDTK